MSLKSPDARFFATPFAAQSRSSSSESTLVTGTRGILLTVLELEDIRAVVLEALQDGLRPEIIDEFTAAVDWSHVELADPVVRKLLGLLELWGTEFGEGGMPESEYRARLEGLLSRDS